MNWPRLFFTMPLILAGFFAAPLALHSWRRREMPGAIPLTVMALAVIAWTASTAVYLHVESHTAKALWNAMSFVGIVTLPPAWLAFSFCFTGHHCPLGRGAHILAVAIGFVMVALVATNGWHLLVWHDVELDGHIRSEPAVVYIVFEIYAYLLSMAGIAIILEKTMSSAVVFRKRQCIMILAGLAPILTNLLHKLGIIPMATDPTPLGFFFSTLLVWWGLFRWELLDFIPVAHNVLLDSMNDGMLVIDARERILEMNRAVRMMLEELTPNSVGHQAGDALKNWTQLREMCRPEGPCPLEVIAPRKSQPFFLEASATPIIGHQGRVNGYLLLFRDITERRRLDMEREKMITELRDALGQVKKLSSLLPICSGCKKIRDKADQWHPLESFFMQHTEARFTHGLCPDCINQFFPDN